eukprot:19182-Heterococcus_DN1.PRE.3
MLLRCCDAMLVAILALALQLERVLLFKQHAAVAAAATNASTAVYMILTILPALHHRYGCTVMLYELRLSGPLLLAYTTAFRYTLV